MIIKVNDTTYINFNETTKSSKVIDINQLQDRKALLEEELATWEDTSDEALLIWAKANFPSYENISRLKSEIDSIKLILQEINGS